MGTVSGMARTLTFEAPEILTTTEARTGLSKLAAGFREEGIEAGIVFFGPHRRPDGAIVPAALLEALAPHLEDIVIAEGVRRRRAEDTGERLTAEEAIELGRFTVAEVEREANRIAAELGV